MTFTLYQMYWIFVIYAFVGWCCEVAFAAVKSGTFVNRGFLTGPVCPIYGFGMLIVALLLTPLANSWLLLFVGAVVLTSLLELVTGFVLERFFHQKWWDYSAFRGNIGGYICPQFSLLWGVACVAVMKVVQPLVMRLIDAFPHLVGIILLCVTDVLFALDLTMTVVTLCKLQARCRRLEEFETRMRRISDELGEGIFKGVEQSRQLYEKHQPELEQGRERLEKLRDRLEQNRVKLDALMAEKNFGAARLKKAFPNLGRLSKEREENARKHGAELLDRLKRMKEKTREKVHMD